jgi:AcrR family transcriptional regulator
VSRWEPNAAGRLQEAALELFGERGYERTTVEDIAGRAGLTKRTFFRHFTDKREVLFRGGQEFRDLFVTSLKQAPADLAPFDAVALSLSAGSAAFAVPREFARRRREVIAANAELQERELAKLARLAAELAAVLRERGVGEPEASLAAETGMAVFRVAFDRWATTDDERDLAALVDESLHALRVAAAVR